MGTYFYRGDKHNPPGTYDAMTGELLKDVNGTPVPQNPHKGRAIKPTDNRLVNETAKAGLLANAEAADNEAREHERRANEADHTGNLSSDRTIYRHFQEKRREHVALAELARSRAKSFRDAAARLA